MLTALVKPRLIARLANLKHHTSQAMTPPQKIYIVTAIHCPSTSGMNPNCYTITGAYTTASAAQKAMQAKAKEMWNAPLTHWHGSKEVGEAEWKENPFKVEFKGKEGDVGVCWVDERVLGVEDMPITQTLKKGRFGMKYDEDEEDEDEEWNNAAESALVSLLRF
jgi:hypothetical protein